MKVAFFGSCKTIFTHAYIRLLESENFEVKYFNNNVQDQKGAINYRSYIQHENKSYLKKIMKFFNFDKSVFFLNFLEKREINANLSENEKKILRDELLYFNADYLIFFWGTTFRKEIKFIKTLNISAQKIIILNTYPVRTKLNNWNENKFMAQDQEYFSFFDKLIFPSKSMYEVFNNSNYIDGKKVLINPDFIVHEKINYNKTNISAHDKKIIFLGNTDFSSRNIDDIRNIILNIAKKGIKIYIQESHDAIKMINYSHNIITYKPFDFENILNGDLIKYINQFDGVLFSYNDVSKVRYNSSITTRMLLAEGCDIPVFILGNRPEFLDDELIHGRFKCVSNIDELSNELTDVDKCLTGMTAFYRAKEFISFLKD
ncbi:hypothetical protein ABXZ88_002106 [Vibrio fluvialis]|nr:hypothetical protein [Vibrio fluvialis]MBY7885482.1 hypothetical protein [Vibrio fluvialis]MBY7928262.1 hypothetical protein [Vibrio fluvialis]MBY8009882.1 hypothetical protein [Vibrio fluvialis]MBY8048467.1 hypothetical protein [Vibrio fluvialis]